MNEFLNYTIWENGAYTLKVSSILSMAILYIVILVVLYLLKGLLYRFAFRKRVDKSRTEAIYNLFKYLVWIFFLAAVLEMAGIHVTLFIAGSAALLVGLGLGLQQIFQDLVSGVFILTEGTIKINDVIELDGMVGKIHSVNMRTSTVLTRDGIVIIVPNHKFITETITNWSHNSDSTRFKVEVGVAYGSDVDKVKALLLDVALHHTEIIKETDGHGPFVRFTDFGDSALKFEVYFWTTNIYNVEFIKSDLRFEIDKQFRREGITIPFPQRDLHIKTNLTSPTL